MKRILGIIAVIIIATCAFAQEHLEFMGIPVTNYKEFTRELEKKGFQFYYMNKYKGRLWKCEKSGLIVGVRPDSIGCIEQLFVYSESKSTQMLDSWMEEYKKYKVQEMGRWYRCEVTDVHGKKIGSISYRTLYPSLSIFITPYK